MVQPLQSRSQTMKRDTTPDPLAQVLVTYRTTSNAETRRAALRAALRHLEIDAQRASKTLRTLIDATGGGK
jgi:hypothetical protein